MALVLGAALLGVSAPGAAGGNLLVNGGAESGVLAPWVKVPPTAPIVVATQVVQTLAPVLPASGSFFFSFAGSPQSGTIALRQQGSMPGGLSTLRLSGRYQTEFGDVADVYLRLFDARGALLEEQSTGPLRNADELWKPFEVEVPAPEHATSWEVELRGALVTGSFINVFFDDLLLGAPCPADLDGNGIVDGADLGLLLAAWGSGDAAPDLDGSGTVDGADLGLLLAAWGPCA